MRNRILVAILAATAVAVVLFGLPLALAVQHLYHSEAVVRLEREAARATTHVPDSLGSSGDPVELPAASDQTQLALYSADGRLVTGSGPAAMEAPVRAAFGGRVAERTVDDSIVVAVPVADEERVVAVVRAALPASVVDARVRRAWLVMAALAVAAVAVAAMVARALAGRLGRPVDALAVAAARLGEGDFSMRAGRSGVAEVDAVARTLDATGARLGQVLARERAFSADASHQLRTALAGLRLRLEAAGLLPGADQAQAIADALAELDRLEGTVEQLLALARDAGVARDQLDLSRVIEAVEQGWRVRLGASERPLRLELEGGLPRVRASEAAVLQILDVLVGNAAEHGLGTVTVRARAAPGGLAIEVGDEGPGVAGDPEQVFARRAGSAAGHGIGLALARSLAEAEGGRLLLQRPEPGPVFAVLLPADRAPELAEATLG